MSTRTVVVVESERDYSAYIREVLEPYGLHVEIYADGNRALDEWRSDTPALFVICVEPRSIGYAICARARKTPHLTAVPVILYSAEATAEQFEQHMKIKTHANEYLYKPFEANDLLIVVDQLIGLSQGEEPTESQEYGNEQGADPLFDPHDLSGENALVRDTNFESTATDVPAYGGAGRNGATRPVTTPMNIIGEEVVLAPERAAPKRQVDLSLSTDLETEAAFDAIQQRDEPAAQVDDEQPLNETDLSSYGDEEVEILSNSTDLSGGAATAQPGAPAAPLRAGATTPTLPVEKIAMAERAAPTARAADSPSAKTVQPQLPKDAEAHAPKGSDSHSGRRHDSNVSRTSDAAARASEPAPKTGPAPREYSVDAGPASGREPSREPSRELPRDGAGKDARLSDSRPLSASGDAGYFAREREYLTLREAVNRKEKEILDLKDERDAKERLVLDHKEKLRELERTSREAESRVLGMERDLMEARETGVLIQREKDQAVASEQRALASLGEMSAQLERTKKEAAAAEREHTEAIAALRSQHASMLEEQRKANEIELATLRGRHSLDLEKHRTELRNEAEAALGRALTEAAARARAEQESLLTAAERRRVADLEAARTSHDAALAASDRAHADELAQTHGEHEAGIAALRREHGDERNQLQTSLGQRTDELQASRAETEEVRRQVDALARSLSSSTSERDRLSAQLATEADRNSALAADLARSTARTEELELSTRSARSRIDDLERQLVEVRDQLGVSRAQLETDDINMERAKKALALAIVVLDESRPANGTSTRAATTGERATTGSLTAEHTH